MGSVLRVVPGGHVATESVPAQTECKYFPGDGRTTDAILDGDHCTDLHLPNHVFWFLRSKLSRLIQELGVNTIPRFRVDDMAQVG